MTVTQQWDLKAGLLYLRLAEGAAFFTEEVSDSVYADLDGKNALVGIEVLEPGKPWPLLAILRDYPVPEADQHELMAGYPFPVPVTGLRAVSGGE